MWRACCCGGRPRWPGAGPRCGQTCCAPARSPGRWRCGAGWCPPPAVPPGPPPARLVSALVASSQNKHGLPRLDSHLARAVREPRPPRPPRSRPSERLDMSIKCLNDDANSPQNNFTRRVVKTCQENKLSFYSGGLPALHNKIDPNVKYNTKYLLNISNTFDLSTDVTVLFSLK